MAGKNLKRSKGKATPSVEVGCGPAKYPKGSAKGKRANMNPAPIVNK